MPCFAGGKLDLDGAYNTGNMPLTAPSVEPGTPYTFILRWTDALTITVLAYIGNITSTVKADGVDKIKVSAETDGSFVLSLT